MQKKIKFTNYIYYIIILYLLMNRTAFWIFVITY